jgi:hypothetical protein
MPILRVLESSDCCAAVCDDSSLRDVVTLCPMIRREHHAHLANIPDALQKAMQLTVPSSDVVANARDEKTQVMAHAFPCRASVCQGFVTARLGWMRSTCTLLTTVARLEHSNRYRRYGLFCPAERPRESRRRRPLGFITPAQQKRIRATSHQRDTILPAFPPSFALRSTV